ncbi:MAG: hypothetical protein IKU47_05875 [Oscillospiraceae bacterium]|nr:hypothetical protein [Oscillospiraceae bacterium]
MEIKKIDKSTQQLYYKDQLVCTITSSKNGKNTVEIMGKDGKSTVIRLEKIWRNGRITDITMKDSQARPFLTHKFNREGQLYGNEKTEYMDENTLPVKKTHNSCIGMMKDEKVYYYKDRLESHTVYEGLTKEDIDFIYGAIEKNQIENIYDENGQLTNQMYYEYEYLDKKLKEEKTYLGDQLVSSKNYFWDEDFEERIYDNKGRVLQLNSCDDGTELKSIYEYDNQDRVIFTSTYNEDDKLMFTVESTYMENVCIDMITQYDIEGNVTEVHKEQHTIKPPKKRKTSAKI